MIRELLNSDIAKEEVLETELSNDDETEAPTTTTGMDWSLLQSDKWIFDNMAPVVTPDYSNGILEDAVYYYNNGDFIIKSTDNACLGSIIIEKSFRASEDDEWVVLNQTYEKKCTEITTEDIFTFSTGGQSDGWYRFKVSLTDAAGNTNSPQLSQFEIYVDHKNPEETISVVSPSAPDFITDSDTSENWVKEKVDDQYIPITFRIDAVPKGAKLRCIYVDVVGRNNQTKHFEFSFRNKEIIEEDGKYYVKAMISTDPSSNDYLPFTENNTYEVKAVIEAASHNKSDEISYTLHVDTENPVIESFSVERKNTAAATILNILTFGVFANDSLIFTVKVKDGDHDIGLDHVDISYIDSNNELVSKTMEEKSAGIYSCELALDAKVFQSDIVVTAYDKINKSSKNAPRACSHKNGIKNHSKHDNSQKNNIKFIITSKNFSETL